MALVGAEDDFMYGFTTALQYVSFAGTFARTIQALQAGGIDGLSGVSLTPGLAV